MDFEGDGLVRIWGLEKSSHWKIRALEGYSTYIEIISKHGRYKDYLL
jgi:hypothetical protein